MGDGKKKPMREAMPETAAFVDMLRAEFGAEEIHAAIRSGQDGPCRFWACEGGQEIGERLGPGPNAFVLAGADLEAYAANVRATQALQGSR